MNSYEIDILKTWIASQARNDVYWQTAILLG